jgi:hypothetical protein
VVRFAFPMTAMSRDDGDLGDFFIIAYLSKNATNL